MLPDHQIAVDKVVGGGQGDRHRGLHNAVLQVRRDRSPSRKVVLTPCVEEPRTAILGRPVIIRGREGNITRSNFRDECLQD